MTFTRICIYGVGAIGGWIGARLAQLPNTQLSGVARGHTLRALQQHGLILHTAHGQEHAAIQASDTPDTLGVQDLVVLAVKAPALPAVADHITPLLGPNTVVLTAMNGVPWWFLQGFGGPIANTVLHSVDPNGRMAQAIAHQHLIGGVVHASCASPQPGQVQHHFGNGLIIGEPSGVLSERARALHALLSRAGFDATLSPQIQKDIWYKLWGNMTVNPVSALTGATTDKILDDPLVRHFMSQVMLETQAIGARIGIPIDQQPEDRHAVTRKLGAFKTSMLQDVEAARALEIDALIGAVHDIAGKLNLATPNIDALFGLIRLMAQQRGLYPTPASYDKFDLKRESPIVKP